MKYVAIIKHGSGQKNANIFNDKNDAKRFLRNVAAYFKYPSDITWENNLNLS